jgi:hypothetical protein
LRPNRSHRRSPDANSAPRATADPHRRDEPPRCQPANLLLDRRGGEASSKSGILQRNWSTKQCYHPVALDSTVPP